MTCTLYRYEPEWWEQAVFVGVFLLLLLLCLSAFFCLWDSCFGREE